MYASFFLSPISLQSVGEYDKPKDYLEKVLVIKWPANFAYRTDMTYGHCVSSVVHPSRCQCMYISPSLAVSQNLLEFFSQVPHDRLADVQRLKRSYREAKSPDFTLILVPNKRTPFVSDTKCELNFE